MDKLSDIYINEYKQFKLISPKGKLVNNKVYNAFNKNTLSSIPNRNEIYIFDTNKENDKFFFDRINKIIAKKKQRNLSLSKISSPNKPNLSPSNILSNSNISTINESKLNKSKSEIFFNKKEERFSNSLKKEFLDKYSPGPGQYESNISFTKNSGIRYNRLFIEPNSKNKNNIYNNGIPGPGTYNISNNEEIKNCIVNMNSKYKRFKDIKEEKVGPGSYFPDNLVQYNKFDWSKNIPSSFFRSNCSCVSEVIKKENSLSKYINIHKKKNISPGPGEYFKNNLDRNNKFENKKKVNSLIPENIKEEYKQSILKKELLLKEAYSLYKEHNMKNSKSAIDIRSSFFKSNSKRTNIFPKNNHVPGPCYYGIGYD